MAYTATLAQLVTAVRAEAGHALSASQGLNALDSLKIYIQRTQYELWTAFEWPELRVYREVPIAKGQFVYDYPTDLGFDQIRAVQCAVGKDGGWSPVFFNIPDECIAPGGGNSVSGADAQYWGVEEGDKFRIWPTPTSAGVLRLKGMKPLEPLVDDTDRCTLDATLIALRVAAELLAKAKAPDAELKEKAFQRHLQQILGNKVSAKNKVSTFGATRRPTPGHGLLIRS